MREVLAMSNDKLKRFFLRLPPTLVLLGALRMRKIQTIRMKKLARRKAALPPTL
jgi:hypothetical protein